MSDVFSGLTGVIDSFSEDAAVFDPYFYFEPFDCVEPSPETISKAAEDGVDLFDDDVAHLAGPYPRLFQTGALLSEKFVVCQLGASRVGKSITTQVLIGASISRQPPYCLRYAKGEDTGIRRAVTPSNIKRFGRRDKSTGVVIDYNINARLDPASWDCGNIEGVGIFPEALYTPDGKQVWIGTLPRSIDTHWWPILAGTGKQRFLPLDFLDMSRGNHGSNRKELCIHGPRDTMIFIKSYDAPFLTFETVKAHILCYDEEPVKAGHYLSGQGHAEYQRFSFTALNGLSFTQSLFFGCVNQAAKARSSRYGVGVFDREDFDFFQASRYDSPYVGIADRETHRKTQPIHGRKQRVWGRYAEHTGNPFFDRSKIEYWRRHTCHPHRLITLEARTPYEGFETDAERKYRGLLDTAITVKKADADDLRRVIRVYENPKPGVGYLWVADSAAGAVDPRESQDFNFGLMIRRPLATDDFENEASYDFPVIVASMRSTLPTIAFANYSALCLRWYNNAVLAPERGHGKDNEAYGVTLDNYPFWYYSGVRNDATQRLHPKKGFDTHVGTRDTMLAKVRSWLDEFEREEDPLIKDSWLYDELAGAIIKEHANGRKRCDHSRNGYLDGVICLAIATYIHDETPDVIVCNYEELEKKRPHGIAELLRKRDGIGRSSGDRHFGAGVGKVSGNDRRNRWIRQKII